MLCTRCGVQVEDRALFCANCGAPIRDAEQDAPVAMGVVPTGQEQVQMPPQPQGAMPEQAYGAAPQAPIGVPQAPVPGAPPAPGVVQGVPDGMGAMPQQYPVRGCVGTAWDDVKASPGYFKKVLLLALISMVPILNFAELGYGVRWGAEVVHGRRQPLPQKIVTGENFKIGFFVVVIIAIFSIVVSVLSALFSYIGVMVDSSAVQIVGSLVIVALSIFAVPFLYLSMMRIGVFDSLGEGFAFGKLGKAFSKKTGTLFFVSYVPSLIASLIESAVGLVYFLIVGVIVGGSVAAYSSRISTYGIYYNMSPEEFVSVFGGQIVVVALFTLVLTYALMVISALFSLVTNRGIGYYIARFVPEWGAEAQAKMAGLSAEADQQPMAQPAVGQPPVEQPSAEQPAADQQPEGQQLADQQLADQQPVGQPPIGQLVGLQAASQPFAAQQPADQRAMDRLPAEEPEGQSPVDQETTKPAEELQPAEELLEAQDQSDTQPVEQVQPESEPVAVQQQPEADDGADAGDAAAVVPTEIPTAEPVPDDLPVAEPEVAAQLEAEPVSTAQPVAEPVVATEAPTDESLTLRVTRANGDTCEIPFFPVTIGKGSEADLCIPDNSTISRVHVRLLRDGNVFAAEDLGSTNKTFINGYQIEPNTPSILSDGDELALSNEVLRVTIK